MSIPNLRQFGIGYECYPMSNPGTIATRTHGRQCRRLFRAHGVTCYEVRDQRPPSAIGAPCCACVAVMRMASPIGKMAHGEWRVMASDAPPRLWRMARGIETGARSRFGYQK